jgi:hypothetical protein
MFGKRKQPPEAKTPPPPTLRCSFCNKSQHDVKKLIPGPKVQICDECVDICLDILSEEKKEQARALTVDGRNEPSGRQWPAARTLLLCGLCRTPTTLEESLAVPDRGIICRGCVGAFEAALAERNEPS